MKSLARAAAALAIVGLLAVSAPARGQDADKDKMTETKSGLKYKDTKVGTGQMPRTGQTCKMHYTGWLYEKGKKGKKFDSSVDRGEPFDFSIGEGQVIKGWDEGVASMKV